MNDTVRGILVGLLLSVVPLGMVVVFFIQYDNAIENTQVEGQAKVYLGTTAGYILDIRFTVLGHNRCENQTEHWAVRPPEWLAAHGLKEQIRRPILPTFNGIAPPDEKSPYHFVIDLPLNIEPGPWLYEANAFYRCQYLMVFSKVTLHTYGPVLFTVPGD